MKKSSLYSGFDNICQMLFTKNVSNVEQSCKSRTFFFHLENDKTQKHAIGLFY